MKKLLFLFIFPALLIACKDKDNDPDPVKPVSKSAVLQVHFTGSYTSPISSAISISSTKFGDSERTDTSTSISHILTRTVPGDVEVNVSSLAKYANGDPLIYGSYTLRVVYNGSELANKSFGNNQGVSVKVTLPFIE